MQSSWGKPRLPGFLCPCLMSPGHPLFVISVPQTTIPPLSSLASATGCEGCPFYYHSSSGLSSHTCPLPTCQAPGTRRIRGGWDAPCNMGAGAGGEGMWKCLPCRQTPQLYWPRGTLFSSQISCFSPVLMEERHILAVLRVDTEKGLVYSGRNITLVMPRVVS